MNTARIAAIAATVITALAAPSVASAQAPATNAVNSVIQPVVNVGILTDASYWTAVLDVSGGSTALGAKVIQWYRNGNDNQRWTVDALPNGNALIVNQKTRMCLTTNGLKGGQLYMWTCNGNPRQEWAGVLKQAVFGQPLGRIYNPATRLYMDVEGNSPLPGARIIGWDFSGQGGGLGYFNW